ncbi:hypothetical protein J2S58_001342 [Nakamurella flavida]|nr:hypothetical protein [Nakamurella flavida]
MGTDWLAIDRVMDDVLITAGVVVLIVRQFRWRSAEAGRMFRLPMIVLGLGLLLLGEEMWTGVDWRPGDWFVLAEVGLVAVAGIAMGRVTRFRFHRERLQYRLTTPGLGLWAAVVAARVATVLSAARFGADVSGASGLLLISFGVNRLAAAVVVSRRVRAASIAAAGSPARDDRIGSVGSVGSGGDRAHPGRGVDPARDHGRPDGAGAGLGDRPHPEVPADGGEHGHHDGQQEESTTPGRTRLLHR